LYAARDNDDRNRECFGDDEDVLDTVYPDDAPAVDECQQH